MKFSINNLKLLEALKLMQGFTAKSLMKPILTKVHITASTEKQKVCFEATDAWKAAKWYVDANVVEDGEGCIEITAYTLSLLKFYKTPTPVTIYREGIKINLCIVDNIINLYSITDSYPNLNTVFNVDAVESKPLFEIKELEKALKSMASAGSKYVEFNIPNNHTRAVKLIASKSNKREPNDIEAVILPVRKWDD